MNNKKKLLSQNFKRQNLLVLGLCRKEKSSEAIASFFSAFDTAGSSGLVSDSGSKKFNKVKVKLNVGYMAKLAGLIMYVNKNMRLTSIIAQHSHLHNLMFDFTVLPAAPLFAITRPLALLFFFFFTFNPNTFLLQIN